MEEEVIIKIDYLPIVAIVISIISAVITIYIYKSSQSQEVQRKQVELVLELTQNIQAGPVIISHFRIDKSGSSGSTVLFSGELLAVSKYVKYEKSETDESYLVYISEDIVNTIEIEKFLTNPLTPQPIAAALRKAFPNSVYYVSEFEEEKDMIRINYIKNHDDKKLYESIANKDSLDKDDKKYYAYTDVGFVDFLNALDEFRIEVESYLKSQGISNLNVLWSERRFRNASEKGVGIKVEDLK